MVVNQRSDQIIAKVNNDLKAWIKFHDNLPSSAEMSVKNNIFKLMVAPEEVSESLKMNPLGTMNIFTTSRTCPFFTCWDDLVWSQWGGQTNINKLIATLLTWLRICNDTQTCWYCPLNALLIYHQWSTTNNSLHSLTSSPTVNHCVVVYSLHLSCI